ncbi:mas-related G-protein coupled receptor member A2B-like [Erythrolamprus reginae]|uniref:mas-related G-protein coupled receptor member A2B-like n=1 Tax=Erythrolamprus reginae TaxID=121349 RepID=UPI00396CACEC
MKPLYQISLSLLSKESTEDMHFTITAQYIDSFGNVFLKLFVRPGTIPGSDVFKCKRRKKSNLEENKIESSSMAELGSTSLSDSEFENDSYDNPNGNDTENGQIPDFPEPIVLNVILLTLCLLGLLGNGKVIWILGFHMKRNSFSIYVLNLAVADSGVLLLEALTQIIEIHNSSNFKAYYFFNLLYFMFYNTSQLLLISISVDRCVSVLFPIWHQCHRPPKLSLVVCVITWVLPFVYFALELVVIFSEPFLLFQLIFNGVISYSVMVVSSLILLVKIFCKRRQQKRKRVLTVTLLALMCFVVLRLPLSIFSIVTYSIVKDLDLTSILDYLFTTSLLETKMLVDFFLLIIYITHDWYRYIMILALLSDICIVVNSSINPILYFLAGRNKEDRTRVSMKLALHRVFRNEDDTKEDEVQPDETQL